MVFSMVVMINIVVALGYPFSRENDEGITLQIGGESQVITFIPLVVSEWDEACYGRSMILEMVEEVQ